MLKFNTDARDPQSGSLALFPFFQNTFLRGRGGVWGGNGRASFFGAGRKKLDTDQMLMLIIVCSIKISN